MIQVFSGEFLVHPCAVSIEFNHCSHNCVYCYAHTRGSGRKCEFNSVVNRLNRLRYEKPKVLLDWLLYYKFPICMSNWTDPFADNNYEQALALSHHLANIENGLFIQTKGGKGIDEFIENLGEKKNVVWYITITTPDDDKSAILEPNAPRSSERIALVKKLKELGYMVEIGINPLSRKFGTFDDFKRLIDNLLKVGVIDFYLGSLHINKKELKGWSEKRRNIIGITFDNIKDFNDTKYEYRDTCEDYLHNTIGINPIVPDQPKYYQNVSNREADFLGNPFFMNYNFYNDLLSEASTDFPIIDFEYYLSSITRGNTKHPILDMPFKSLSNTYILRSAMELWRGNKKVQSITTFREILRMYFNNSNFSASPMHSPLVSIVNDYTDTNGDLLYYSDGNIQTSHTINIDN